ncbi:myosin-binding protein 2-like [Musa acuminata AAA Group]|uniref:myosin-binding protein 2-like n=1 Tax=Musa acuminata AAA Group TaxID=214697 RepID=UPI0031D98DE4
MTVHRSKNLPPCVICAPAATYPGVRKVSSTNSLTSQIMNDSIAVTRSVLDHTDSFKHAMNNKGIMLSPKFSEIIAGKESSRGQEDLKLRLSRAFDLPWSDIIASPRAEDLKSSDASSSIGLQNIAKRLSVERTNSSLETFDASIVVSDIEGETSVDRLKRQIELDRKCMSALYKELEEERSASTIAANEAMAMINRLQEEKAAMQMEAFQYLRMMEEQAEYDQEAIHKLNDVINERDKELLDLETEFERYRRRHRGAEPEEKRTVSVGDLESTGLSPATTPRFMESRELLSPASTRRRTRSLYRSMSEKIDMIPQEGDGHGAKDLELGFEEEKVHILACLRRLQNKFSMLPTDKVRADDTIVDVNLENSHSGVEVLPDNGSSPSRTHSNVEASTTMDNQFSADQHDTSDACRDMNSVQEEVAKLIKRVVELDADREFIGHTMNALNYGNDGVLLVQEIACQLKELRRIPLAAKEPNVA